MNLTASEFWFSFGVVSLLLVWTPVTLHHPAKALTVTGAFSI